MTILNTNCCIDSSNNFSISIYNLLKSGLKIFDSLTRKLYELKSFIQLNYKKTLQTKQHKNVTLFRFLKNTQNTHKIENKDIDNILTT